MKFNKRYLALAVAIGLTGCGSDDSSSSNPQNGNPPSGNPPVEQPPSGETVTITAIDGYLQNAKVYTSDCKTFLDVTDEKGELTVEASQVAGGVCVVTTPETFDTGRETLVEKGYTLRAPEGSEYVTPITTLVSEQMDEGLSQEEAEQSVIEAVSQGDSTVDEGILFGDYTESSSTEAESIELLAETLVDMQEDEVDKNMSVEQKLNVVEDVSTEIVNEVVDNNGELPEDFAPVVSDDGSVDRNYKPISVLEVPPAPQHYEFALGDHEFIKVLDVSTWFTDADGDLMTYSIDVESTQAVDTTVPTENTPDKNRIYLDGTNIMGVLVTGGEFKVRVYAHDESTKSEPVTYVIYSEVPNEPPSINLDIAIQIESDLASFNFTANETLEDGTFANIEGLFLDPEGGDLTYVLDHNTHADIKIEYPNLVFSGTFNEGDVGTKAVSISALDEGMAYAEVEIEFNVAEPLVENTAPVMDDDAYLVIKQQIDQTGLTEGRAVTGSIDASALFSDPDGDELKYEAISTLEFNGDDKNTGFKVHISDDAQVTFTGVIPRSGDGEDLTIIALDGKDTSYATFELPLIASGEVENPVGNPEALEDKVWFFVEYGSAYGNGHYNREKNWCEGVYFDSETSQMYWSKRSILNQTACTAFNYQDPSMFEAVGTYTLSDTGILVNFDGEENAFHYQATKMHNELGESVISLQQNIQGYPLNELETWIAQLSPSEAQFPLQYEYTVDGGIDAGAMFVTEFDDGRYVEIDVEHNSGATTDHQASIKLKNVQCDEITKRFEPFVMNTNNETVQGACMDNTNNGDTRAIITFNTDLSESDVNSVIGKRHNGTKPNIMLNITRK